MKLFVYGTLKNQSSDFTINHIRGFMIDWRQHTDKKLSVAIKIDKSGDLIEGQIIDVTKEDLKRLDRYEGCPRLFKRIKAKTIEGNSIYLYQGNKAWNDYIRRVKPDSDGVVRFNKGGL
jgi:gamma-glutamylcyclotransferase (GGCT)/AIG2-like uncharacterized protein YtfP